MEYMAGLEDNAFDLAIVDPPYGIGDKLVSGGTWAKDRKAGYSGWDIAPDKAYFKELFRVSRHQIIWGGNYFNLPVCRCFFVWDKPSMRIPTMADCEMAWTSFDKPAKMFTVNQEKGKERVHLCQKPIKLYKRILDNYAEPDQRILDTHLGSGSSAIAAHYFGCEFVGCEIDKDYYQAACKRFQEETRQLRLFEPTTPNNTAFNRTKPVTLFAKDAKSAPGIAG